MTTKHTPGPWHVTDPTWDDDGNVRYTLTGIKDAKIADARLIAAAPTLHEEMLRYLPILDRAEADPEIWESLTEGTGIATANGYRAAIAKAAGEQE